MFRKIPLFIRRVLPDADEATLEEAAELFHAYVHVVARIHEQLIQERDSTNPQDRVRIGE